MNSSTYQAIQALPAQHPGNRRALLAALVAIAIRLVAAQRKEAA